MASSGSLVLLVDLADAAVLGAAQAGLRRFATALCLQPEAAARALAAPPPAAPRPVLGLCNLARPAGAPKPVVQVRCRPGPFALRDFYAAVGRLQPADRAGISAGEAATALQQVAGVVAQDAACAAAGPRRTLLYLTDRTDYEPADFGPTLELCRGKGVQIELVFMSAGSGDDGGGDEAADALAAAWAAAEAAFPHLAVTVVPAASRLSFDGLATSLLQRWEPPAALPVSLAFKGPLLGGVRALALAASAEVRPLAQGVHHAALCPCHRAPAAWAGAAALCAVTGMALDRRQCGRDERTVQVGAQPGGALHLAAPFNIGSAGGGGGSGATLTVLARVKADQANPALLFGVPLLLRPGGGAGQRLKVVHEGELADTSQAQLLRAVVNSLSSVGEALLASSTADLESGAAGLFRLHYLLLPCMPTPGAPPALVAKRVASADELLAPALVDAAAGADSDAGPAPTPAVAEAVAAAMGRVPLEARLDPLALSSRCVETVEMLVRESQPLPKPQLPAAPAAAPTQAPVVQPAAAPGQASAQAAAAGRGRRPAAVGGSGADAAPSGGQRAAGGRGGKGSLEFRCSARR